MGRPAIRKQRGKRRDGVGRCFALYPGMFLIDGNEISGSARNHLIDGLRRLARAYGTPSIVIFEGPGQLDLPHGASRDGVRVLYAGGRGRAKDEILRMVDLDAYGRYTVVTPDRALGRRVLCRGARTAPVLLLKRALEQVGRDERSVA